MILSITEADTEVDLSFYNFTSKSKCFYESVFLA